MASSIREIKQRVVATKKTSQITSAMNMVSASKLKSAEKQTILFRPYMDKIESIISNLTNSGEELLELIGDEIETIDFAEKIMLDKTEIENGEITI